MDEGVSDRKKLQEWKKRWEKKHAECPYNTPPVDMEEGLSDRKNDKNKKNDGENDAEWPDDTPPVDM